MPYISAKDDRREKLRNKEPALTAGELNYQIFYSVKHEDCREQTIKLYIKQFLGEKPNYEKYNSMTGCLIRCAFEIERRLNIKPHFLIDILLSYNEEINNYEDLKIKESSDVE